MSSSVQNILESTLGDVARSTKFEVMFAFTNPKANPDSKTLIAQCKTSSFPGKTHTTIDFKFKGRTIPVKGQTKYTQSWECTFYMTEDHTLKQELENWIEALDQKNNYLNPSETKSVRETQVFHNKEGYTNTAYIYQRDFEDTKNTAKYTLFNVYPTEISPVQIDYESRGTILTFSCTFAYSYYISETIQSKDGNFIDGLVGKAFDSSNGIIDGALTQLRDVGGAFIQDMIGSAGMKLDSLMKGTTLNTFGIGGGTGKAAANGTANQMKQSQQMGANIPPDVNTSLDSKIKANR